MRWREGGERECTYCVIKTGAKGRGGKRGRKSSRPLSTLHLASGESRNSLRPRATSSSGSLGERVRFRGNYDNNKKGRGVVTSSLSLSIYLFFFRLNLSLSLSASSSSHGRDFHV